MYAMTMGKTEQSVSQSGQAGGIFWANSTKRRNGLVMDAAECTQRNASERNVK